MLTLNPQTEPKGGVKHPLRFSKKPMYDAYFGTNGYSLESPLNIDTKISKISTFSMCLVGAIHIAPHSIVCLLCNHE